MTTKEKIVRQSVKLFNKNGISNVTLRHIAAACSISLGNLTYHYKNQGAILSEIYADIHKDVSKAVYPQNGKADLLHLNNILKGIQGHQYKFRFFYLDIHEISRQYPEVIKQYRETALSRRAQGRKLFKTLVSEGYFKKESYFGQYHSLTHAIWLMSTFWLQQLHVLGSDHPDLKNTSEIDYIWTILMPYLSEKGHQQYQLEIQSK